MATVCVARDATTSPRTRLVVSMPSIMHSLVLETERTFAGAPATLRDKCCKAAAVSAGTCCCVVQGIDPLGKRNERRRREAARLVRSGVQIRVRHLKPVHVAGQAARKLSEAPPLLIVIESAQERGRQIQVQPVYGARHNGFVHLLDARRVRFQVHHAVPHNAAG
jgi:hypothetical protein